MGSYGMLLRASGLSRRAQFDAQGNVFDHKILRHRLEHVVVRWVTTGEGISQHRWLEYSAVFAIYEEVRVQVQRSGWPARPLPVPDNLRGIALTINRTVAGARRTYGTTYAIQDTDASGVLPATLRGFPGQAGAAANASLHASLIPLGRLRLAFLPQPTAAGRSSARSQLTCVRCSA